MTPHLKRLENESILILREVAAEFRNPVMLYSIGKDSAVMLHLAMKAFYPGRPPFPLLHIDTTWKFRDMIRFRDETAARLGMTFPTREAYREFWRSHAALGPIWGPVVQAYVDYDLVGEAPQFRSSCREEAMRVDGAAVIDHAATTTAMRSLRTPAAFLRAERGLQGVPPPLYSEASVARWRDGPPFVEACTVPDTDHYSILLGAHGAAVVAAAVTAAATTSA